MTSAPRFSPRVFPLDSVPAGDRLLQVFGGEPGAAFVDSVAGHPRRWSLFAFDPVERLHLSWEDSRSFVSLLRDALSSWSSPAGDEVPGPFAGGFLGALAYDLGVHGEKQRLPVDPWRSPRLTGGLYVDFITIDHRSQRAWLVLGDQPGDGRPSVERRRERILERLRNPRAAAETSATGPLVRHVAGEEHRRRIEQLRARIAQGDLYQANLAHRFTRRMRGAPQEIQRLLRRHHPAPWSFYLSWGEAPEASPERSQSTGLGGALLSTSPELLLECDGRQLRTRPIKGTVARGETPEEDQARRRELLASSKDRAELAMIVDLERNDLGRVARLGSVRVEGLPTLESYSTVHHLVADVRAELAQDRDALDALAAIFPGGSITGAPKLRAMQIIAELEGEGRGLFTGAAGFLDLRGRACFNVLIRSLVWRPLFERGRHEGEVSFHVGGGITWSSDAELEEQETLDKGAALAAALEGRSGDSKTTLPYLARGIGVT